jgi:hypothetical protein
LCHWRQDDNNKCIVGGPAAGVSKGLGQIADESCMAVGGEGGHGQNSQAIEVVGTGVPVRVSKLARAVGGVLHDYTFANRSSLALNVALRWYWGNGKTYEKQFNKTLANEIL